MAHSVPDFIPVGRASRGKGPRTKRQMRRIQRKAILDAKLEFLPPLEEEFDDNDRPRRR